MTTIRLNKYLAQLGIASRRAADEIIAAGQVKIDGIVCRQLGTQVDPVSQKIEVSGAATAAREKLVYLVLNKPTGYTTSNQPTKLDPKIVLDLVKIPERVFPVGRLDKDTTGLLILTNDGVLAYRLTHPKWECEKEYEVTLTKPLTEERVRKIEAGVRLEHTRTRPTHVEILTDKKARIILTEGRNRQVRKVFGKVGCEVLRLQRVRVKKLELGNLPLGQWRYLTPAEVADLLDSREIANTISRQTFRDWIQA